MADLANKKRPLSPLHLLSWCLQGLDVRREEGLSHHLMMRKPGFMFRLIENLLDFFPIYYLPEVRRVEYWELGVLLLQYHSLVKI